MRNKVRSLQVIEFVLWALAVGGLSSYGLLFVRSFWHEPTLDHVIKLLFLWQTQTAGAFALLAALIGALAIYRQTRNARLLDEARRERRAVALRAALPLVLAEVAEHAEKTARDLAEWHGRLDMWQALMDSASLMTPHRFQQMRPGLLEAIPEYMEVCNSTHQGDVALLLRVLQIQQSRLRTLENATEPGSMSIVTRPQIEGNIIDAAEVFARCERLIEYAREQGDRPPKRISADDVCRALFLMGLPGGMSDELSPSVRQKASAVARDGRRWLED